MTEQEAIEYVRGCGEDEGPESYGEAADLFAAIFGRRPDASDGDQGELWSHVCAAVSQEATTMTTTDLTADTITDDQIRTLRTEAEAAGDYGQVDLCNRALATDTVDQDGNAIALADLTREDARAACAEAINAARAME